MAMPERVSASIFSSFQFFRGADPDSPLTYIMNIIIKYIFRGADPDSLDTNGNNICHMMVILNKVVFMLSTTR